MKRLLIYILAVSLLVVAQPCDAYACSGPYYLPSEYMMFRGFDVAQAHEEDVVMENCEAWQRLTSMNIPLADIRHVVYKMSLEEYEQFYYNGWTGCDDNLFAQWIHSNDKEILDFLLLAKTNEEIRLRRNSRWYYPTMRVGLRMTIEEVVEKSLLNTSPRLRDRYLLQVVRALFTLGRYDECVELWNNEISLLHQDNIMRKLIQPYIAGAEFRLGNSPRSLQHYAERGDAGSIAYCSRQLGKPMTQPEVMELIYKYNPTCDELAVMLQREIRGMELWYGDYDYWTGEEMADFIKLRDLSWRIAREGKRTDTALWYYALAFLYERQENTPEASRVLRLAEQADASEYVKESIKVMRIYLDAKTMRYDAAYEQRLHAQLKWLDGKIRANITPEVIEITTGIYPLKINKSFYYWNDMMRRILLTEVCPRMIKVGKITRALQLANMADNRLLGLVDEILHSEDTTAAQIWDGVVEGTLGDFRRSKKYFNTIDYSNNFFSMIDSIGVNNVKQYCSRVLQPKDKFDSFLNERGYVDSDYLNDIVGTQCLRNMRYSEAAEYLGKVSPSFAGHLNVNLEYYPFKTGMNSCPDDAEFKFRFAKKMCELEDIMHHTDDQAKRAKAMVAYATGLKNSFGHSWQLVHYYKGGRSTWQEPQQLQPILKIVERLVGEACAITPDREYASRVQYEFGNYRKVATEYYDTPLAKKVWGQCDNLIDYHAERRYR